MIFKLDISYADTYTPNRMSDNDLKQSFEEMNFEGYCLKIKNFGAFWVFQVIFDCLGQYKPFWAMGLPRHTLTQKIWSPDKALKIL